MKTLSKCLIALLAASSLVAVAAPRKYERANVFNPGLAKNVDLHYEFADADLPDSLGFKVVEQYYMDGCNRGFIKMERIADPDAHLFKVIPNFGCDAYGIGFTLDFKKGWFLIPNKTSGKYPTGAFLLNWAEVNKKTPSFVLSE